MRLARVGCERELDLGKEHCIAYGMAFDILRYCNLEAASHHT